MDKTEKPKTAVMMRTYDELDLTRDAIKKLFEYTPEMDMFIVVDASCFKEIGETRDWLNKFVPPRNIEYRKVLLDQTYWTTYAWNRGKDEVPSDYKYLVNVDNDIFYTPNWLTPMISLAEKNAKIAEVVPLYCRWDWVPNDWGYTWRGQGSFPWESMKEHARNLWEKQIPYPSQCPTSSCALFRMDALRHAHLWDEKFCICLEYYMSFAFHEYNWETWIQPKSKVMHLSSYTKGRHGTLDTRKIRNQYPAAGLYGDNPDRIFPKWSPQVGEFIKQEILDKVKEIERATKHWSLETMPDGTLYYKTMKEDSYQIRMRETWDKNYGHYYERYLDLKPGMNVVDAGATCGMWTSHVAKLVFPGKVIAIEPSEKNFIALLENIEVNNLGNIVPYKAALWRADEAIHFDEGDAYDLGRVWKSEQGNNCEGYSLDTIIKENKLDFVDVLKLDVEGAEYEILSHIKDLKKNVGTLIIETHSTLRDITQFLYDENILDIKITPIQGHIQNQIMHVKIGDRS